MIEFLSRVAALILLVLLPLSQPVGAQGRAASGAPTNSAAPQAVEIGFLDRTWAFVRDGQREMSGAITATVRRLKSEGSFAAALALATVSFIYGVLHAVGPGHGKFVISSYALASERTARRATLLSFMAALIQALSAIVIVGVLALILKATSLQLRGVEAWLETISWSLIAVFGAWLLYRQWRPGEASHDHSHAHSHAHAHDHAHGAVHEHLGARHDHKLTHHDHAHGAGEACDHHGHSHLPEPAALDGEWRWAKAWSLAFAIGIRPCTGAIAVLVFAGSIGLFWAGVLSAFTMAIGTALTVSALASLAVGSRELAARFGGDGVWAGRVQKFAAVAGSALVFLMGVVMSIASLQNTSPL